jgi:hypothetical protein
LAAAVKDKLSPRQSAWIVLGVGILFDVLVAFLDHAVSDPNAAFTGRTFDLLIHALGLFALLGLLATSAGSVMWARRASTEAVIAAVIGLILMMMIYVSRVRFGFDDERVVVAPFAGLVVLLMIIGRAVGHAKANREESSTASKTTR